MFLKGRRIRAVVVYEAVHGPDPYTPEEFARKLQVPLEAVREALSHVANNLSLVEAEAGPRGRRCPVAGTGSSRTTMRVLIDENMSSTRLAARLRSGGQDIVLATEVGLVSVHDAHVVLLAVHENRSLLTRDHEDFAALHDLVMAVGGHHPGILVFRFDMTCATT